MSGKISGMVWDLDLPHAQMLVLLAMADHADHEGRNIYPSIGLIAWKCGYSDRQVQRIIKDLVDIGVLAVQAESTANRPTTYNVNISAAPKKAPYTRKRGDKMTPVKMSGVTFDARGVTFDAVRGDTTMSPEPIEPSYRTVNKNSAYAPAVVASATEQETREGQVSFLSVVPDDNEDCFAPAAPRAKRAKVNPAAHMDHPAVAYVIERTNLTPAVAQRAIIAERVKHLDLWRVTVDSWLCRTTKAGTPYNPRNYAGMLEMYAPLAEKRDKALAAEAEERAKVETRRREYDEAQKAKAAAPAFDWRAEFQKRQRAAMASAAPAAD